MKQYEALKEEHSSEYNRLNQQSFRISMMRLLAAVVFVACLYYYFKNNTPYLLFASIISLVAFLFLLKKYGRITRKKKIENTLVEINADELSYLKKEGIPYADGIEFTNFSHAYAHDLDIFGNNSLFQNINRTATHIGKTKLSSLLLSLLSNEEIKLNQEALKELTPKVKWRQHLFALSKLSSDSKAVYEQLINWSKTTPPLYNRTITIITFVSPALLLLSLILLGLTEQVIFRDTAKILFLFNLVLTATQLKKINREVTQAGKIHDTILQYSRIIKEIERENFKSVKLNSLKEKLNHKNGMVSKQVKELSSLFASLDNLHNLIGALLFNGIFLYHLHVLRKLGNWKKEYVALIPRWLDVIGEIEALNSLANFTFNNPEFTFPELNDRYEIALNDLGHPLIKAETRVNNSVSFNEHKFIVLTGSNMSGKSTFLRTLGTNMVLAGIGAPICASSANVHPMDVLVSMRLSDSLNDSESYFFAEVKRLKEIIETLKTKVCFVLLDEILRGTNSDDKRSGTVGVIKKIIEKKAIGAIATHDLEVCLTTNEYPNILANMCFEVEIINNDLVFDYRLRSGICKNKSATFLMKKMEII